MDCLDELLDELDGATSVAPSGSRSSEFGDDFFEGLDADIASLATPAVLQQPAVPLQDLVARRTSWPPIEDFAVHATSSAPLADLAPRATAPSPLADLEASLMEIEDENRRSSTPTLQTSVGYYARQLPRPSRAGNSKPPPSRTPPTKPRSTPPSATPPAPPPSNPEPPAKGKSGKDDTLHKFQSRRYKASIKYGIITLGLKADSKALATFRKKAYDRATSDWHAGRRHPFDPNKL